MRTDTVLKPCPFCGCEDELDYSSNESEQHHVICMKCGAEGGSARGQYNAALYWNMRYQQDHFDGAMKSIRGILDALK